MEYNTPDVAVTPAAAVSPPTQHTRATHTPSSLSPTHIQETTHTLSTAPVRPCRSESRRFSTSAMRYLPLHRTTPPPPPAEHTRVLGCRLPDRSTPALLRPRPRLPKQVCLRGSRRLTCDPTGTPSRAPDRPAESQQDEARTATPLSPEQQATVEHNRLQACVKCNVSRPPSPADLALGWPHTGRHQAGNQQGGPRRRDDRAGLARCPARRV